MLDQMAAAGVEGYFQVARIDDELMDSKETTSIAFTFFMVFVIFRIFLVF